MKNHTRRIVAIVCVAGVIAVGALAAFLRHNAAAEVITPFDGSFALNHVSSWVANSFGGGLSNNFFQENIGDMSVAADGTVYTDSGWDESGHEAGIYKDGVSVGFLTNTHGWRRTAGSAVAVDAQYVYIALYQEYLDDAHATAGTYPPKNTTWYAVARYFHNGTPAAFPGGIGFSKSYLLVSTKTLASDGVTVQQKGGPVTGLALADGALFVANATENTVTTFDVATLNKITSWPVTAPRKLVASGSGTATRVWAVSNPGLTGQILSFSKEGTPQPGTISDTPQASALALDPATGHLLVGDAGPAQQIHIYDVSAETPRWIGDFGVAGGVYGAGAPAGTEGPQRLLTVNGIGLDASGNLYVAGGSWPGFQQYNDKSESIGSPQIGSDLRKFAPDGTLLWHLEDKAFVTGADADPATDGQDIYTRDGQYAFDYAKPAGQQATRVATTYDPFTYSQDPRNGGVDVSSPLIRNIEGHKIMFMDGMYDGRLAVYRFDGNIAVPAGYITPGRMNTGPFVTTQPSLDKNGYWGWIWRDSNGDAKPEADEYAAAYNGFGGQVKNFGEREWSIEVQPNGDIWLNYYTAGVVTIPFEGFDAHGNPVYDPAHAKAYPIPAEFIGTKFEANRSHYDPATDTLFIVGNTNPVGPPFWGLAGNTIMAFADFTKGTPHLLWRTSLPIDTALSPPNAPKAVAFAGSRIFVGYVRNKMEVRTYDTHDGSYQGSIYPTAPAVVETWLDMTNGLRAYQRADGTYVVMEEEDWGGKTLVYQVPAYSVCLDLKFQNGSGSFSTARDGLVATVSDVSTNAPVATSSAASSDDTGRVTFADRAFTEALVPGKTYRVSVGGGGYVPSSTVLTLPFQGCQAMPEGAALLPGDLSNNAKVSMGDLIVGIRAYNGASDAEAKRMEHLLGRKLTLSDLNLLIKGYNKGK